MNLGGILFVMCDSTFHVRWWNDWFCVPPWWAVGAFEAGNASCSSLYWAPHACRKSVNGVWVILNFHEHIKGKDVGGRGDVLWGMKPGSLQKSHLYWAFTSSVSFPPCRPSSSAQTASAKGHCGKAGCFFPGSFEAAWRLRVACLKVTWFPLKCEAAPCFGDPAVYGGCCCACQTVWCEGWRHCTKGCERLFLTNELLWKSQVRVENASYNLLIQCLNTIHSPWACYCV